MTVRHVSETQEFDFFNSCADGLLEGAIQERETTEEGHAGGKEFSRRVAVLKLAIE